MKLSKEQEKMAEQLVKFLIEEDAILPKRIWLFNADANR